MLHSKLLNYQSWSVRMQRKKKKNYWNMFTSRRANESAEEEERIGMNEAEGKHQHTQTCAHTRNLKSWTIRQTTTTTTITLKIIKAIVKELEPNNNNKIVKQFQAYFVLVSAERVYLCTATFLPVPFFLNDLPFACTFFHSDSVGRRIKKEQHTFDMRTKIGVAK